MQVHALTDPAALESIADPWNALAAGDPLNSHHWLGVWARHYSDSAPYVLTVHDQAGELVGLAPWRKSRSLREGAAIRWLGDGEVCSDHTTILAAPGQEKEVVEAIARFLLADSGAWDCLCLENTDADNLRVLRLIERLRDGGCGGVTLPASGSWTLELPATWEEFFAMQSRSHRGQLRRAERNVLSSDRCEARVVRTEADLEEAWPVLIDLHQQRWEAEGEPGCFASARFTAFHHEATRRLLGAGMLHMQMILLDGRPAAIDYNLQAADTIHGYQGGLALEFLPDSPGRLMRVFSTRRAVEAGFKHFDMMRGDESYKAHWRGTHRAAVHYRVAPPRVSARVRAAAEGAYRGLRSAAKRALK
ncbi:hypothetical protein Pla175_08050 [Pirellulimonas nuda]|uniref:BioF2-like acetyltransferase domain-containing protein n=1 Tax=Pirellulimonas nuda TaxID=2528009 RepID=A0A518D7I7_9BACT|nr:GNAT family N-acetyltransferase [Pirellulimonas nuda]QDU87443.1 hypothetical protein Pla175_08050 [Pirellulimonas nuda]